MHLHALLFFLLSVFACNPIEKLESQAFAKPDSKEVPPTGFTVAQRSTRSDSELFQELLEVHWPIIFPDGGRNAGGPQFFKYIYENLATNHDLFQRYNRFYCGVSGSIVRPNDAYNYDIVKVKDEQGRCIVGRYHRCCWPCSCDVMKHARVESVSVKLPKDPSGKTQTYWLLTIGDPCQGCDQPPCPKLPLEVSAFECKDGVTQNGLRVHEGKLTTGTKGRLVFAMLHNAMPAILNTETVDDELMMLCKERINATPADLEHLGGMGNIFVELSLINSEETFSNSEADLCE